MLLLKAIVAALNKNIDNDKSDRWSPWFIISSSGFSFGGISCRYSDGKECDSDLEFKNQSAAMYAGEKFIDLYRQLYFWRDGG